MRRLMVYGYEHDHDLTNVNLGDYIQSIAANQFMRTLSRESYFSRDNMEVLRQNDFAILNGWYRINEKAHLLRFPVNVLPVSIHVSNPEATEDIRKVIAEWEINGDGGDWLQRSIHSQFIEKMGFNSYFSSCLTTTLFYQFGRAPFEEREGVVFCDVDLENMFPVRHVYHFSKMFRRRKVEKLLNEIVAPYKNEFFEKVSHSCSVLMSHENRFALASDLLRKYSRAKLVVTSRIHCALPCVAMGTPVILLVRRYDQLRYPGIDQFLNRIYLDSHDKLVVDVNSRCGMVFNNDKHIPYAEKLISQCESFVRGACS